jgi:hypothetical protein
VLGFARFAMKSPLHTGILAALFSALPFGFFLSSPLVGLIVLRHGFSAGTRTLGFAMLGGTLGWLVFGLPLQLLILPLVAAFSLLLRETQSWGSTLIASAFVGLMLSFGLEAIFGGLFDWIAQEFVLTSSKIDEQTGAAFMLISEARPIYKYVLANGLIEMTMLSLLWSRYWQAALFNPGGLKAELHSFKLSRAELLLLIGGAVLAATLINSLAIALFSFPFIFAGLALVHGIVAKLKLGGQWVVAMYIALILFNQIILPLLVLLVLADSIFDIRSKIPERSTSDNE